MHLCPAVVENKTASWSRRICSTSVRGDRTSSRGGAGEAATQRMAATAVVNRVV